MNRVGLAGERSGAYSPGRMQRATAVTGIVLGFLLGILPGVFALASYRDWKNGLIRYPYVPWFILAVVGAITVALIFGS